jgi:hypothetical protein
VRVPHKSFAGALVAAALLVGCSSSPPGPKVDHSAFHPNENRFTKPLDYYQVTAGDSYAYASHLIFAKCMAERGYHINVANPADWQGAAIAISVPLSVKRAERYGYHIGPARGGVADTLLHNLSPRETAAANACGKRAEAQLGLDYHLDSDVAALAWGADDAAEADPKVKAAAQRWHACMLPLGVPDLPAEPTLGAMPTPSQHRKFWPTGGPEYLPTNPLEIRQAVFDAKCRQSSGWDHIYYQAIVDHQFALMDQHPELIAEAGDQARRVDANIAAAIRSNGG